MIIRGKNKGETGIINRVIRSRNRVKKHIKVESSSLRLLLIDGSHGTSWAQVDAFITSLKSSIGAEKKGL
ncbi:hypothetical protein MUK42_34544 [Musa troglodytarum]|uniref:KOW domain-containing protein n=1 Tax=Musa troglodytarum TaxID=320322 RepID=A0A9E7GGU5_9LILI|nr:hypothetical protein MUK42_34544 [Musa troglodytarum]